MTRPRKNLPTRAGWRWFCIGKDKTCRNVWTVARITNSSIGLWFIAYYRDGKKISRSVCETQPSDWGNPIKCKPV